MLAIVKFFKNEVAIVGEDVCPYVNLGGASSISRHSNMGNCLGLNRCVFFYSFPCIFHFRISKFGQCVRWACLSVPKGSREGGV